MSYEGYSNYETWIVKIWIDNDQGSYLYWQECANDVFENSKPDRTFTRRERAKIYLADMLESEIKGNAPELTGTYADLLTAALSAVDWQEIAGELIDDIDIDFDELTEDEDA